MIRNVSLALLVAANLLPVLGVLYWDWDVFSIMFLFWCENVVIGLFGVAKTVKVGGLFLAAFFLVHYGGFMFGHLMVIMMLFADDPESIARAKDSVQSFLEVFDSWTLAAIAGLFISHGWSFVENFIGKREYESLSRGGAMSMAYKRMVITHVALIAGGFFLVKQGEPIIGLLILLAMKIVLDVVLHNREHSVRVM